MYDVVIERCVEFCGGIMEALVVCMILINLSGRVCIEMGKEVMEGLLRGMVFLLR